ncbi:polyprenyl synthetase family protein [Helicobacter cinaedi]|uniref:Polyprenyl synthetase n=1 Tax=Helicobacter cinaedi CCUG 18818 = ATCC BAA-847 TaxID=537971 RepID=A0ABN0BB90_9HELI|nr:polyprenyl synthetase family protein [Helicobacter cinaedi]EFR46874.1 polyprenyl synthetase [Helicobacter cinaedi CCUG 18818 = ATCC BAA-847]QOQ91863.1 polyprenyl synthetase family protein [Helicobacter cinaedi]QOQ97238.1 polyprenyl synthetase family protein [Helicobacter cinaedi]
MERIKAYIDMYIKECGNDEVLNLSSHLSQGKMLRSKLLLAISGVSEDSLRACALIEMIQSASLLHDDVIDEAQTRRQKPSINALFGNKNAIMLGDVLYSKAFYELSCLDVRLAQSVSSAVVRLSIGEIEDVSLASRFHIDKQAYIKMCGNKTAALIVAAAECGAILKGLNKNIYRIYGENLGIAFQIIDDILDFTQDSKTLGKPSMSDFKEGKVTLPLMLMYEKLDENEREIVQGLWATELSEEQEIWIKVRMQKHNAISQSIDEAKVYANKALMAVANESNAKLQEIITQMIERTF